MLSQKIKFLFVILAFVISSAKGCLYYFVQHHMSLMGTESVYMEVTDNNSKKLTCNVNKPTAGTFNGNNWFEVQCSGNGYTGIYSQNGSQHYFKVTRSGFDSGWNLINAYDYGGAMGMGYSYIKFQGWWYC
ncbi:hypothetical protein BB559_006778 [Furculomyces boomerangus]|uniref:Uncharacterized protein n=2 Tax=Harpellales TaxID=61421 RepID=A0A2T9Y0Q4_9FUNG|nr:hypothetical protein BB559_006778 [Furculomyces boomerangus]PWA01974.1 hypothetical protein BB558_001897 [Smittium angustum]